MKNLLTILLTLWVFHITAQVTLEKVLNQLEEQSPESAMIGLNRASNSLEQENLSIAWQPQLGFTAQSTYQSEVTSLNIEVPGIDIPRVDQFQYKAQAEINQLIYDGGSISAGKEAVKMQGLIQETQSMMDLDQVKGQVINLYFSILEAEQVVRSLELKAEALEARRSVLQAGVNNGVILESELNELDAAILQLEQEVTRILNMRFSAVQTLAVIIGDEIPSGASFEKPSLNQGEEIDMAPLLFHTLLNQQSLALESRQKAKETQSKPKLAAFGQAGVGQPGLNFLDNSLSEYYIVGLRLNWQFSDLYTRGNDRQILQLNQEKISTQKAMFDRQWKSVEVQIKNQIDLQEELIEVNNSLVDLRSSISEVAAAQLDNGVINTADYISKINEEYTARINLEIATIRRLKSQYQLIHHYNQLP